MNEPPTLPSSLAVNDVIEFTADDGTRSSGAVGLVDLVGCFIGDGWTCRLFDTAAERLAIKIVRRGTT